ncbi:unnamed protein product [Chrysoparadoxa australica]
MALSETLVVPLKTEEAPVSTMAPQRPRRGRQRIVNQEFRTNMRRDDDDSSVGTAMSSTARSSREHSLAELSLRGGEGGEDEEVAYGEASGRDPLKKRVSFTEDEGFRPSYETYTPRLTHKAMKYRAPETRAVGAVAPPSSVHRPNYHDAMRRVSIVVYNHIYSCERRMARALAVARGETLRSTRPASQFRPTVPTGNDAGPLEVLNSAQIELFHEENFIQPQYKCTFIRHGPMMAIGGLGFTLSEMTSDPQAPTVDEIYEFITTLFNKACLSSECSLVCLIYVERLMEVGGIPLLALNWKPIVLCGLLLASKVWQDLSSWNVEFSTVYPQFPLKAINRLEHMYLQQIRWDLYISSSLYAKYYFALRSLTEKESFRRRYNVVMQIDAPKANMVQERSDALKSTSRQLFSRSL